MPNVQLNLRISSTQNAVRVPRQKIRQLVELVARQERQPLAEVDIALVNSEQMAQMNYQYLRHRGDTDVLSFDLSDGQTPGICAQLVICGDVAARQGPLHGTSAQRELLLYVVHGLLHMMGYDDQTIRGAAAMHAREDELLDEFRKLQVRARKKVR